MIPENMHVLSGLHLVDTHYVPYCERDCGKSLKNVFGCMVPAFMLPLFSGNRFSWCQSEEKEEMWPRGNLEYVFVRLKWLIIGIRSPRACLPPCRKRKQE